MRYLLLTTIALFFITLCFSQKSLTVGQRITGDFNGDGKTDTAFVKQTTKAKVRNWTLLFSDKTISSIRLGCCEVYLINEGDLNKNKTTEISVFQAPENGCTYMWTTYSYIAGTWTKLIPMFLVPTGFSTADEGDDGSKLVLHFNNLPDEKISIEDLEVEKEELIATIINHKGNAKLYYKGHY